MPVVTFAVGKPRPQSSPGDVAAQRKNWVAIHIFDSIYPMTGDQTFPEALGALETLTQLYTKRKLGRDIQRSLGISPSVYGDRSREGHFTIWIRTLTDS